MAERVDLLAAPDWFLQPADLIPSSVASLIAAEPVFARIFGRSIFDYQRMDISAREMPALRLYVPRGRKEGETWYTSGDLKIDIILPPSVRRPLLQRYADVLRSAVLAWLRSQLTLTAARALVPGLNRLGWTFDWDSTLGFNPGDQNSDVCPMTQVTADWRVLMTEWDAFAQSDGRERDTPFRQTVEDLLSLTAEIQAKDDAGTTRVTVQTEVTNPEE